MKQKKRFSNAHAGILAWLLMSTTIFSAHAQTIKSLRNAFNTPAKRIDNIPLTKTLSSTENSGFSKSAQTSTNILDNSPAWNNNTSGLKKDPPAAKKLVTKASGTTSKAIYSASNNAGQTENVAIKSNYTSNKNRAIASSKRAAKPKDIISKSGKKYVSKGSTGRTEAKNLNEKLAMKEIMSNPSSGVLFRDNKPLNDPRWKGWLKMSNMKAHGVEIHYNAQWKKGKIINVDDFKFIDEEKK